MDGRKKNPSTFNEFGRRKMSGKLISFLFAGFELCICMRGSFSSVYVNVFLIKNMLVIAN